MPADKPSSRSHAVLIAITGILLAWGAYVAVGTYFGANLRHDWRRSLVVLASMAAFLGVWWILLFMRPGRSKPHK